MPQEVNIEIIILDPRLHDWGPPRYHSALAAAIDLHACLDAPLRLQAQAPATLISAGFAIHMGDPGMTAIVVPRSGQGHRRGLVLGNLVGVIDADYTGPIMVSAWNRSEAGSPSVLIEPGERIAQMIFVPILRPAFRVVEPILEELGAWRGRLWLDRLTQGRPREPGKARCCSQDWLPPAWPHGPQGPAWLGGRPQPCRVRSPSSRLARC